jgi:hypothetical protein
VEEFHSRQGDTVPDLSATVTGIDLRGYTWKAAVVDDSNQAVLTESATVIAATATEITVTYVWQAGDTDDWDGTFKAVFVGTKGTDQYTIPKDDEITLVFRAKLPEKEGV